MKSILFSYNRNRKHNICILCFDPVSFIRIYYINILIEKKKSSKASMSNIKSVQKSYQSDANVKCLYSRMSHQQTPFVPQ